MAQDPLYDPRTALIVVDVQNDFADPAGNLYVPEGEKTIPFINDQVTRALLMGAMVVYTQDWHPESTSHFAKDGGVWPTHCVMGTPGADLHPELEVSGPVLRKGSNGEDGYSAFTMRDPDTGEEVPTALHAMLAARSVQRVVLVGLAQDVCVKATALDAAALGYSIDVPAAGTRPVNLSPGDELLAWDAIRAAGANVM